VKTILAAGLAATLALTAGAQAGDDEYAQVHTVAIVSVLSAGLHWETTGLTHFDYKIEDLHLDWNVDDHVERSIADALRGRFTVSAKPLPHALFDGDVLDHSLSKSALTSLGALPEATGVDAYIVVMPARLSIYFDTTGIVVSHHHGAFGRELTDLRSAFWVNIFDAHTGKRIDSGAANSFIEQQEFGLMERCDNAIWADTPAELNTQQRSQVADAIKSVIDKSLPFALSNATLIPKADAHDRAAKAASEPGSATCHPI
jgi:hypothetical protein